MKKKQYLITIAFLVLAVLLAACGDGGGSSGKDYPADVLDRGAKLYISNCSSCHAENAQGLQDKGKDLTNNEYIMEHTDEELLAYVLAGRTIDDPLNTTGIEMPPKGGSPALTSEQILEIIAYLRTFQQ